jgi:predicted nucleotidyltransferase
MRQKSPATLLRERLPQLKRLFASDERILAVFLFGSQTDGYATPQSDVDLAVLFDRPVSFPDELALNVAVTDILGTERFDLLNLNQASLILRQRAISGRLLYERDPVHVSDFIEETIRAYIDFAPDLRAFYRDYDVSLEEAYGFRHG